MCHAPGEPYHMSMLHESLITCVMLHESLITCAMLQKPYHWCHAAEEPYQGQAGLCTENVVFSFMSSPLKAHRDLILM